MEEFYFVHRSYEFASPETNRALGNLKELDAQGIKTTAVFFVPDYKKSIADSSKFINIKFVYYWKVIPYTGNRIIRLITEGIYQYLFLRKLKKGDTVYIYNEEKLMHKCIKRKGFNIYHERTEHPETIGFRNPLTSISLEQYYSDCRKINGLFVISSALKAFFAQKGVKEDYIRIINMTVDPSRFYNLQKQETERYIAYCGAASNNKDGVDILLKAFSIVAKKTSNIKLYIVGPKENNQDTSGNLRLISELDIQDKVVFTGVVHRDGIPQILKNADVLALARPNNLRAQNGFPTKLGEYLLTENPVVVTPVGDIPQFLKDEESAFIPTSDDYHDFALKLLQALENKSLAHHVGKEGAKVALQNFNSSIETKKMISFMFKKNINFPKLDA